MAPPGFAVDRMLGRLARWLRLLRFDAVYRRDLPGAKLLVLAAREHRILLTRDRALVKFARRSHSAVRIIFLTADHCRDQLRELDALVPLGGIEGREPRCSTCNQPLESLAATAVPASVPEYVRATQREFMRCPRCRRIYWPATHRLHMADQIASLALTVAPAVQPKT